MKLNLSCLSFAVVLSTLLLVKTTVAWQFNIPRLHTLQPADPTANATVRFTVIDVHDNRTTTHCSSSFSESTWNSTNYPTGGSPIACRDPHFGWYFSAFSSLGNFSINIIHTYIDPAVGPTPQTLFGTGDPINEALIPQLTCYVLQTGAYGCAFAEPRYPIVVPVTSVVAKPAERGWKRFEGPRRG
ncbi:hypothetical protein MMC34_004763 [Xylographa carneopallida]|nr:hypothetical protein [Xylographa carneopallida]